jgi:tRNA threonylcarbamoyladenosine biosynthesis protein TsaB
VTVELASVELAISGSNPTQDAPFSAALRTGGRVLAAQSPAGQRGDLATLVQGLCQQAGVAPAAIGVVRIDVGPGSYTGLRVAVTFARFLAAFGDVGSQAPAPSSARIEAVSTLAWLALRGRSASGRRLVPLLDARRERVHAAVYELAADGRLHAAVEPAALPLAEVVARLAPGDVCVLPRAFAAAVAPTLAAAGAVVHPVAGMVASELFDAAVPFVMATTAELEPHYLMASYAEP